MAGYRVTATVVDAFTIVRSQNASRALLIVKGYVAPGGGENARGAGEASAVCTKPSAQTTGNGGAPVRSTWAVANGVAGSPTMRHPFAGDASFTAAVPPAPKAAWPLTMPVHFASWNHFSVRSAGAVIFRSRRVWLVLKATLGGGKRRGRIADHEASVRRR